MREIREAPRIKRAPRRPPRIPERIPPPVASVTPRPSQDVGEDLAGIAAVLEDLATEVLAESLSWTRDNPNNGESFLRTTESLAQASLALLVLTGGTDDAGGTLTQ